MPPMRAALDGARQIGFTVVSISVSLVAAFIPLLFMDGVVGRLLREFSVTLVFAIAVSTGRVADGDADDLRAFRALARRAPTPPGSTASSRRCMGWMVRGYMRTLDVALRHRRADADRHAGHRRRDGQPLHQDAQGLLPAGRYRADLRLHAGLRRHLLRGDGRSCSSRRSTSCWPIPPLPASAPRSARRASTPRSTRGACSSA